MHETPLGIFTQRMRRGLPVISIDVTSIQRTPVGLNSLLVSLDRAHSGLKEALRCLGR